MPNESFEYTVIFETANNIRNIQDELKFYQRIKGTDRKIKSIDHYMNSLKKIRYIYYFGYILSFFMTLPIVYLLLDFFPNLNRKVLVLSSIVFCFLLWLSCIHFSSYMSRHVMKYRKENKKQQEMEG